MNKPRVFITRQLPEPAQARLLEAVEAEIWPEALPPSREVLIEKVSGVDGLLCLLTDPIDAEVMDAAGPQLKVISNCAVGVDNIDLAGLAGEPLPNLVG